MLPCFTCGADVISLSWQHFWYWKLGSGIFMFEQQWRLQLLLWQQNNKLLPTHFLHTPYIFLLGSTGHLARGLLASIVVLGLLTWSPFASKLYFQAVNWFSNPSKDLSITTKSYAYSSSYGHPHQQSWDNASITITNSTGLWTVKNWTAKNWTLVNSHFEAKLLRKVVVYTDIWCSIRIHCLNKSNVFISQFLAFASPTKLLF